MYQHRYRRGIEYNQTLVGDNGDLLAWSTQIDFVRQSDPPGGWYGEVSSSDILTVIAVAGVTDFVLWVVVMSVYIIILLCPVISVAAECHIHSTCLCRPTLAILKQVAPASPTAKMALILSEVTSPFRGWPRFSKWSEQAGTGRNRPEQEQAGTCERAELT